MQAAETTNSKKFNQAAFMDDIFKKDMSMTGSYLSAGSQKKQSAEARKNSH